jgi:uncharacterized protein
VFPRLRDTLPALLLTLWLATLAGAALPDAPARHFTDAVGLVSADEATVLADELYAFEQRTGIQFVVAVLPELDGSLEDYTARVYEHWGLGSKGDYRGVLFLVFPSAGQVPHRGGLRARGAAAGHHGRSHPARHAGPAP